MGMAGRHHDGLALVQKVLGAVQHNPAHTVQAGHKGVAARVEELLREQLLELGEDPASLAPHLIMQNMQCEVYPDESMVYIWKDIPILRVAPERTDTGVMWRMFTRDEGEPLQ